MISNSHPRSQSGIALLTTLLLMLLMSSLLVGFIILVSSGQRVAGINNDYSKAFYAAEAGMEQLTAGLGTLFDANYAPSAAQVNAITTTPPSGSVFNGVTFTRFDGSSGYTISFPTDGNGNPLATTTQIKSGPYQGMTALATPYTLNITARTTAGSEVKLQRTTQTVGIPMFQFGIFSDLDLSFFPGPQLEFGGRTHTNGNLFMAANNGPVWMDDHVTTAKDVVRADLSNGVATSGAAYGGPVNIAITTGAASTNPGAFRTLQLSEGSITAMPPCTGCGNPSWPGIAAAYKGYLRTKSDGVLPLNLGIVTVGAGATQSIDIIRRAVSTLEIPSITNERYFSQASLKILLSDDPKDITSLPCIDPATPPFDLSQLAGPPAGWVGTAAALSAKMTGATRGVGYTPLPLAASGAASGVATGAYNPIDGYWLPNGNPIIKGFIKIEAQYPYSTSCNTWHDVTLEVLSLGYVGRNIHPVPQSLDGATLNPDWPVTSATQMAAPNNQSLPNGPSTVASYQNGVQFTNGATLYTGPGKGVCPDPHPNAIIRLERVRDNPSSIIALGYQKVGQFKAGNLPKQAPVNAVCGMDPTTKQLVAGWTPLPTDFWPNVLFDPREGSLRDNAPAAPDTTLPSLNGAMNYIEVDAANLARWFSGTIGDTGKNTYDGATAPNDFVVYISDRRGNHVTAQTWAGTWPPLSPQNDETGEYGWDDLVNPGDPANGCPNNALDTGEDFDSTTQLYTYGADPTYTMQAGTALAALKVGQYGTFNNLLPGALLPNPAPGAGCAKPYAFGTIWPMVYASSVNAVRENPPLFFRRAIKIVNGSNLLNSYAGAAKTSCAGSGIPCGLTIATENPAYLQGDYNSNSAGNGFGDPHVATSIAADAMTFLSNNWNDANTFFNPYSTGNRTAGTTFYRTAIIAGKNVSFPQPAGTAADYGTDGGLHNFLRYVENWGGQTLNYTGSIISEYYSRQANANYKCCNTVYSPPTRGYKFDVEFLTPALLPPRTPLFRDVNTTGFTELLLPTQ